MLEFAFILYEYAYIAYFDSCPKSMVLFCLQCQQFLLVFYYIIVNMFVLNIQVGEIMKLVEDEKVKYVGLCLQTVAIYNCKTYRKDLGTTQARNTCKCYLLLTVMPFIIFNCSSFIHNCYQFIAISCLLKVEIKHCFVGFVCILYF